MRANAGPTHSQAFHPVPEREGELKLRQTYATRRRVSGLHRTRIALDVDVVSPSKHVVERQAAVPSKPFAEDGDIVSRERMINPHSPCCTRTDTHSCLSARVRRDKTPTVEQRLDLRVFPVSGGLNHERIAAPDSEKRLERFLHVGRLRNATDASPSCTERSLEVERFGPVGERFGALGHPPLRLGQAYFIQQACECKLALDARECLRGSDGDRSIGVKPSASCRQ